MTAISETVSRLCNSGFRWCSVFGVVIKLSLLPKPDSLVTEFFSLSRLNLSPDFNVLALENVTQSESLPAKLIRVASVDDQLRNFPLSTNFRSMYLGIVALNAKPGAIPAGFCMQNFSGVAYVEYAESVGESLSSKNASSTERI